ncbi:MBOAT family O-acyltransferase [Paenibacillus sp. LPE1-1-1.1]|uniref:MBOAT family O-acyltransferase n=1 Tax=Paenibacillus sp. LPE1-1-1.1 TaxID=3135230 RepID=UPI00343FB934
MVFSSVVFLMFFLPCFLLIYYVLPFKTKNLFILLASYIFYAWGSSEFLYMLIVSTFMDYVFGLLIDRSKKVKHKKIFVSLSIIINLSLLAYFKYANFFVDQFNDVLVVLGMTGFHWINVALPVGISFFTFHKISYIVDVYRGKEKAMRSYIDFSLYIALFPQLIAGPIIRFNEIASQFKERKHSIDKFFDGMWRFSIGLGKKVILANAAGRIADEVFQLSNQDLSMPIAWIGIICYSLQIYFDFSGYSDMAIGLGKMMGFDIPENFNMPYISKSITEFWRRWHISLSRFFRDYVYIPLGGNREGAFKTNRNLWIVFFLTGFWHGASWNFIIWGLFHGLFLVIEKNTTFLSKSHSTLRVLTTYFIVLVGWVFFRVETLSNALLYLTRMFDFTNITNPFQYIISLSPKNIIFTILALILSFVTIKGEWLKKDIIRGVILLVIWFYCILLLSNSNYNPFIYFRF